MPIRNIKLNGLAGFLSCALFFCILTGEGSFAQKPVTDPGGDEKWARAFLMAGDYVNALKEYQLLIKKDSLNTEYNFNLATCYLNTNIDKTKALPYMIQASKDPKMDIIVFYDLGRAYQTCYRFDEAIEAFKKYKSLLTSPETNYIPADMQIEMCNRAKEMVKHPVNVTFENLGARINTPFPDYSPYITRKENMLYFTSKRSGNLGNLMDYDGYYTSDLFYVENKYGTWDKCKRLATTINTPLVEEMAGLSGDGNYLFAYIDNLDARFQVRYAVKEGKSFQTLQAMGPNVNPNNQGASAATITKDKKTLIFAADREGGRGGSDLYVSRAMPNGSWSVPENLGSLINTDLDEDYPQLANDDKRLYFSSVGHNSMGGYDIFYSDWDSVNNRWAEPQNIGYPVNTPDDNVQICFTASGRYAYMAALRPEGFGNLDIYRVIFHDVKSEYTTLKGAVTSSDSLNVFDLFRNELTKEKDALNALLDSTYLATNKVSADTTRMRRQRLKEIEEKMSKGPQVTISVTNKTSGKHYGTYRPNALTGRFAIALEAGEFQVKTECEGYAPLTSDIKINDMEMPVKEINQNFVLTKL